MQQVLKSPYITEKSLFEASRGWFTFLVEKDTNKKEIKQAVDLEYKVHVISVKTINVKPKTKRTGRKKLLTQGGIGYKKAMVKLTAGEKIAAFDVSEQKKK